MRTPLTLLVAAGLCLSGLAQPTSARAVASRPTTPAPVLKAGPDDGRQTLVEPVDRSRRALSSGVRAGSTTARNGSARQLAASPLSTWAVSYDAGFDANPAAKAAFQRAVDTWSRAVQSPVTITVTAKLRGDLGTDVLGSARPTALCLADNGYLYAEALFNAVTGSDNDVLCQNTPANSSDGSDISADFSSSSVYYYGADPAGISSASCTSDATPDDPNPQPVVGSCYDFESVVLHELGHGLGFIGSAFVDDATDRGYYGDERDHPFVYDYFTRTAAGTFVLDIANGSRALALALTDDTLFWDGPQGASADRGREPQLYAPDDATAPGATSDGFQEGSSYSHVDVTAYPSGDADALMSPYAQPRDITRDPGEVALGMMRDMGWVTPALPGTRFTPLTPKRVLDASGVASGTFREISVTGAGVPADAVAVVLNLTTDKPTSTSVVRAYPRGRRSVAPVPSVSNVNTVTGDTRANLVTVPVGLGGRVRVRGDGGTARLIADLAGYYAPDTSASDTGFTAASSPTRLMDTRKGKGVRLGTVGAGGVVDLQVSGVGGVPADATAVTLTVTAVQPSTRTYVSVYPTGAAAGTSNINLQKGAIAANQVVVKLGTGGKVRFRNAAGAAHLLADLAGWYAPSTGGGLFRPTRPTRVLDTRKGSPLGAGTVRDVSTVLAGVPAAATAVVANLTGVGPTTTTYLTVFPFGRAFPGSSNVNLVRGQTAASLTTTGVSSQRVRLRNTAGTTHALLDVAGWFAP